LKRPLTGQAAFEKCPKVPKSVKNEGDYLVRQPSAPKEEEAFPEAACLEVLIIKSILFVDCAGRKNPCRL
jgi:hypothetical protein